MAVQIPNLDPKIVYINPTHVKVYVNEYWLDDVVDINFQIQDQKEPLYGFKSNLYDGVGLGKTLVTGSMACLYRYPGYLARVLDTITSPNKKEQKKAVGSPLTERILTVASADAAQMLKDMFKKDPKKGREAAKQFADVFFRANAPDSSTGARSSLSDRAGIIQGRDNKRFDLRIVYGRMDTLQTHYVQQVIQDVLLVGEGQMISVLDGQGDTCLYEQYSFFARNVVLS
jgi:hypothetical protein